MNGVTEDQVYRNLSARVITQAMNDIGIRIKSKEGRPLSPSTIDIVDAGSWIFKSERSKNLFSFENICVRLGLSATRIRNQIWTMLNREIKALLILMLSEDLDWVGPKPSDMEYQEAMTIPIHSRDEQFSETIKRFRSYAMRQQQ